MGETLKNNKKKRDVKIIGYNGKDRPLDKKSKLYFFVFCPQHGLNTQQSAEFLWRDNYLTTKNSRFFIGHLIYMNSLSVERGLELDIPVPSRNQTSLMGLNARS